VSATAVTIATSTGLRWNLVTDIHQMLGFEFMRNAFLAGTVVSVVAGVVGYFVVLRRTAFAAHALSHIGFAGAAGAVAIGVNPLWGLLAFCLSSGAVIGGLGQRLRERDTIIGIVLAFSLGLGSLFITFYTGNSNEAISILFGEILGVSSSDVVLTTVIGVVTLGLVAVMYRPLLFSSVDEDVAQARRVPVRMLSVVFMMTVALAVAVSVQVVGVLLIFALIVTPAAVAERVSRSPGQALVVGLAVALLSTWIGLTMAFYSSWPVSFFITSLSFGAYVVVRVASWASARARANGRQVAVA